MISQFTISLGFFSLTISRFPKAEVEQRLRGEWIDQSAVMKASSKMLFSLMTGASHSRALLTLVRPLASLRTISAQKKQVLNSSIHNLSAWVREVDSLSSHVAHFASRHRQRNQSHDRNPTQ